MEIYESNKTKFPVYRVATYLKSLFCKVVLKVVLVAVLMVRKHQTSHPHLGFKERGPAPIRWGMVDGNSQRTMYT